MSYAVRLYCFQPVPVAGSANPVHFHFKITHSGLERPPLPEFSAGAETLPRASRQCLTRVVCVANYTTVHINGPTVTHVLTEALNIMALALNSIDTDHADVLLAGDAMDLDEFDDVVAVPLNTAMHDPTHSHRLQTILPGRNSIPLQDWR